MHHQEMSEQFRWLVVSSTVPATCAQAMQDFVISPKLCKISGNQNL